MWLDKVNLSPLQLQSTSTQYSCDIKATQSCQTLIYKEMKYKDFPFLKISFLDNMIIFFMSSIW